MKKLKTTILGAAVALLAMGYSAHATLVTVASGTPTYTDGSATLGIDYTVVKDTVSGIYTYTYALSSSANAYLTSFVIGGIFDPVYTATMVMGATGGASTATISDNSVGWTWNLASQITSTTVSYTSDFGPANFAFTVQDDGAQWHNPPLIPAPVPEASTAMAGLLMLLPLGIGAFRSLRKERVA